MSILRPLCVLALPVLLGCSAASSAPAPDGTRVDNDVDSMASAAVVQRKVPGLSVAILEGPDVSFAKGYGVQDVTRSDAVTPDTVFQLGSIGKQFLAALVLRLAERGRISLHDAVSRHMPERQQLPPGLKVRHLLTHTSGIGSRSRCRSTRPASRT